MVRPIRVYWDACVWISFISQEKNVPLKDGRVEDRFAMCESVIGEAKSGKVEIVTSAFTLAEVYKSPGVVKSPLENLPAYFERSYILIVPVDLAIGRAAQELQGSGLFGIKPPDAVHVVSARRAVVSEMHSFDERILSLDGQLATLSGSQLRICKPGGDLGPGPLFQQ